MNGTVGFAGDAGRSGEDGRDGLDGAASIFQLKTEGVPARAI